MQLAELRNLAGVVRAEIGKAVVGQADSVNLMLTALFAGGHVLLEGPPGTAKTLLAQCFAYTMDLDFGRVQFTPDLMPGDILGSNLFNFQTSAFTLTKGPIFCDVLLADEINRTPPKTQAALLEAMQERGVTLDGTRHALSPRFTVIATQNPIEQQGAYPLPEAQLDRFLFKHVLSYPSVEEERRIVASTGGGRTLEPAAYGLNKVLGGAALEAAIAAVAQTRVSTEIVNYIVEIVRSTRANSAFELGASPRAASMLAAGCRAWAALDGRDYVIPDDVKALAAPALRHRVLLSPAAEVEGRTADTALAAILQQIEAPR
ncbi:MAG: MoxR family ATPase [Alphaproteobacteria bacterium]|nr:MoxR family ATPase [Alphaproteobacteria bacterium]